MVPSWVLQVGIGTFLIDVGLLCFFGASLLACARVARHGILGASIGYIFHSFDPKVGSKALGWCRIRLRSSKLP